MSSSRSFKADLSQRTPMPSTLSTLSCENKFFSDSMTLWCISRSFLKCSIEWMYYSSEDQPLSQILRQILVFLPKESWIRRNWLMRKICKRKARTPCSAWSLPPRPVPPTPTNRFRSVPMVLPSPLKSTPKPINERFFSICFVFSTNWNLAVWNPPFPYILCYAPCPAFFVESSRETINEHENVSFYLTHIFIGFRWSQQPEKASRARS